MVIKIPTIYHGIIGLGVRETEREYLTSVCERLIIESYFRMLFMGFPKK
jgi:hypothetical protein